MDLPVNFYSHWKSVALHWTGISYCVMWLQRDLEFCQNVNFGRYVYIAAQSLHGVTCYKTVTIKVTVSPFIALETAKFV